MTSGCGFGHTTENLLAPGLVVVINDILQIFPSVLFISAIVCQLVSHK